MSAATWLHRSRWWLLALVVLLPAAALVALSVDFFPSLGRQAAPVDVPRGVTAHYDGATVRLIDRKSYRSDTDDGERYDVPPGTELVVATIAIDPSKRPRHSSPICSVSLAQKTDRGERRWESGYGSGTSYSVPRPMTTNCDLSRQPSYRMQAVFLVPVGAHTARLELSSTDLPGGLRLD